MLWPRLKSSGFPERKSWGSTSLGCGGFVRDMDPDTRKLIDHLGSELARIMEDASATAALLPGVPEPELGTALERLERAAGGAQALVSAMRVLLSSPRSEVS